VSGTPFGVETLDIEPHRIGDVSTRSTFLRINVARPESFANRRSDFRARFSMARSRTLSLLWNARADESSLVRRSRLRRGVLARAGAATGDTPGPLAAPDWTLVTRRGERLIDHNDVTTIVRLLADTQQELRGIRELLEDDDGEEEASEDDS